MTQVVKLADWILEMSGVLYAQCDNKNDFFMLHGVTGLCNGTFRELHNIGFWKFKWLRTLASFGPNLLN